MAAVAGITTTVASENESKPNLKLTLTAIGVMNSGGTTSGSAVATSISIFARGVDCVGDEIRGMEMGTTGGTLAVAENDSASAGKGVLDRRRDISTVQLCEERRHEAGRALESTLAQEVWRGTDEWDLAITASVLCVPGSGDTFVHLRVMD